MQPELNCSASDISVTNLARPVSIDERSDVDAYDDR